MYSQLYAIFAVRCDRSLLVPWLTKENLFLKNCHNVIFVVAMFFLLMFLLMLLILFVLFIVILVTIFGEKLLLLKVVCSLASVI